MGKFLLKFLAILLVFSYNPIDDLIVKYDPGELYAEKGESMDSQSRLLHILRYLYDFTDAEHDVSSKDIMRMLESKGISPPDRRTIDSDIDALIAVGHDIQKTHRQGAVARYRVVERDFDTVELKILIDAVAASQFINAERSKHIIERLASLASISDRKGLVCETASLISIKNAVGRNLYVADDIYRAIISKRKIQYQMVDYSVPDMELIPHREGHIYTISPYALIWSNDRYYLVGHEEERNAILTPRVDHIQEIKVLDEPIKPVPPDFDIGYYYSTTYKMYTGPEHEITLICDNSLIGKMIDRFGKDFECIPVSDHAFKAVVRASIGPTFYGWLFQYAGKMTLAGPPEVVNEYNKHRKNVLKGPKET